jgi:hypothetical protein
MSTAAPASFLSGSNSPPVEELVKALVASLAMSLAALAALLVFVLIARKRVSPPEQAISDLFIPTVRDWW